MICEVKGIYKYTRKVTSDWLTNSRTIVRNRNSLKSSKLFLSIWAMIIIVNRIDISFPRRNWKRTGCKWHRTLNERWMACLAVQKTQTHHIRQQMCEFEWMNGPISTDQRRAKFNYMYTRKHRHWSQILNEVASFPYANASKQYGFVRRMFSCTVKIAKFHDFEWKILDFTYVEVKCKSTPIWLSPAQSIKRKPLSSSQYANGAVAYSHLLLS